MLKNWFTPLRLRRVGLLLVALGLAGNLWLISGFRTAQAVDCDDNAVIRCGVASEAALKMKCVENLSNTQAILNEFGISNCSSALDGLVLGQVTSNNNVYIRNSDGSTTLVGTDAVTAGRQRISSSDTPIAGGAAYMRPPSESFRSSPLSALVKMDGNTFLYAVIMSCGNPVKATPAQPPAPPQPPQPPQQPTPPPPPSYEISKSDRLKGQTSWLEDVIARPDDHVQFRLVIKNTGQTALDNTVIKDSLPSGLTFVDGSLVANNVQQTADITKTGVSLPHFAPGDVVVMTFEAVASNVDACNDKYLTNTGIIQPPNLPSESDTATVQICKPSQHVVTVIKRIKSTKPAPQPQKELINTGPGSIGTLFMVTSLAGAALYQTKLRFKRLG